MHAGPAFHTRQRASKATVCPSIQPAGFLNRPRPHWMHATPMQNARTLFRNQLPCVQRRREIHHERPRSQLAWTNVGVGVEARTREIRVEMDINGWVSTRELSEAIGNQRRNYHWLRGWHFEAIANADEKGRYQVENRMISLRRMDTD